MRLFHVSEESNIEIFHPRIPNRDDMDKEVGLIWALDEKRLPNFLTPRNCPRVTYHISANTSYQDKEAYFPTPNVSHVVIIEQKWWEAMKNTILYLYEFDTKDFVLLDDVAGYYVSTLPQKPIGKYPVANLLKALSDRNVQLKVIENLWDIAEKVQQTTLNWSLCRMNYAQPRN